MVWTSVDCGSSCPFGFQVSWVTDGLFICADQDLLAYSGYMAMSLHLCFLSLKDNTERHHLFKGGQLKEPF